MIQKEIIKIYLLRSTRDRIPSLKHGKRQTIKGLTISMAGGIVKLFQTFEDLESVKDKQAEIQAVREVFDEEGENGAEVQSC